MTAPALAAIFLAEDDYTTPAPNQWPLRIALVIGLVSLIARTFWGMRRVWKSRASRQSSLLPLPVIPGTIDTANPIVAPAGGVYLGTARAGDWQDRIVTGGLGRRSTATLALAQSGLLIRRPAEDDILISRTALTSVRADKVGGGRILGTDGVFVVRWRHNDAELDSAFRADDKDVYPDYVFAIRNLISHQEAAK